MGCSYCPHLSRPLLRMNSDPCPGVPVPPHELHDQWRAEYTSRREKVTLDEYLVRRGAAWGADEQLKRCVEWLGKEFYGQPIASRLQGAMRPTPNKNYVSARIDRLISLADREDEYCKLTVKFLKQIREALSEDSD